jgi:hypothetical protein
MKRERKRERESESEWVGEEGGFIRQDTESIIIRL